MKPQHGRPLASIIFAVAAAGAALATAQLASATDDCATATVIGAPPFSDSFDTSGSTNGVDDQVHSCTGALDTNTVWYEYVAPANQTLDIDMLGTSYGAVVAIYDACGPAATEVACFYDDTGEDTRAPISVRSGATLYIQVSDAGGGGGPMSISINDDPVWKVGTVKSIQRVVGTSSPSGTGPSIGTLGRSTILSGRVAAYGARSSSLWQRTAAAMTPIVASGTATPIGGVFRVIGPPAIQNAGSIAFWASVDGAPGVREGLFSWNGAVVAPIVVEGDPDPTGGTYRGFEQFIAMNAAGDIAFSARISAAPDRALFVMTGAGTALVAREDDPSPCGGLFRSFSDNRGGLALSDAGDVAFIGSNDSNDDGAYLWQGAGVLAYACEGAAAPVLGGVFDRIGAHIDINVFADGLFQAEIDNGSRLDVMYAGQAGAIVPIAVEGGALAGTTIAHIDQDVLPAINDARQTAFPVRLAAAPFRAIAGTPSLAGAPGVIVAEGAACPFGGVIENFGEEVDLNLFGEVVTEVGCTTGRGLIRGTAGGGFGAIGNNTDPTGLGSGWMFRDGQVDAVGDVVLRGRRSAVYGSICGGGGCTLPILTAKSPLPIPGSIGGNIESVDPDSVNGSKEAAFLAVLSGAARTDAILRGRPGGPIVKVVETGDPLPTAVGTFGAFYGFDPFDDLNGQWRPASQGRKVAFAATVDSVSYERGMFQAKGATIATLAYDGMVTPTGETIEEFSSPSISGNRVVFAAETDVGDCVYVSTRPTLPLGTLICAGDAAPVSVGGTIGEILGPPTIAGRRVSFAATVSGGSETECMFAHDGATFEPIVCVGAPLPGGGTLEGWDSSGIGVAPGSHGKGTGFTSENASNQGVVLTYRKDSFYNILKDGDVSPGGFTVGVEPTSVTIKGKTVVFNAGLSGAPDSSGVFMARLK